MGAGTVFNNRLEHSIFFLFSIPFHSSSSSLLFPFYSHALKHQKKSMRCTLRLWGARSGAPCVCRVCSTAVLRLSFARFCHTKRCLWDPAAESERKRARARERGREREGGREHLAAVRRPSPGGWAAGWRIKICLWGASHRYVLVRPQAPFRHILVFQKHENGNRKTAVDHATIHALRTRSTLLLSAVGSTLRSVGCGKQYVCIYVYICIHVYL